jgi:hypothetical protein
VCLIQLFIEKYNMFKVKVLNVSTKQLKPMACGSRFQSNIVRGKQFLSLLSLTRRENERMHAPWLLFLVIHVSYFFRLLFYIHVPCMIRLSSLYLSSILYQFKLCNMWKTLDVFRCLFLMYLAVLSLYCRSHRYTQ